VVNTNQCFVTTYRSHPQVNPEDGTDRLSRKVRKRLIEVNWTVTAHAQKPDLVFQRNERVRLNRRGCQFSRLLAAEVCASAVVMLDKPCSEVVWRVLATHSIRQFPIHFPPRASTCAITFQMEFTTGRVITQKCGVLIAYCNFRLPIMGIIFPLCSLKLRNPSSISRNLCRHMLLWPYFRAEVECLR